MNHYLQVLASILLISQLYVVNCFNPLNCDPNTESLFVEDPTDRQAFFSCKPYANYPSIGFWSRHYCPDGMHFEYSSQQCTTDSLPPNTVREANDLLQLAILNGSCAHGEQCIGGTVCDPVQQRCLCPYGTVALLENLFCAKLIPPAGTTLQQQYSYGGQYSSQVPLSAQRTSTSSPLSALVPIGSYCDQEGTCDGGSTCVNSVCVCPAKTQNNGNNCTSLSNLSNFPSSTNGQQQLTKEVIGQGSFFRAKLGEQCNEYLGLLCADQSSLCFNGYCQCIPPMIEQQGQCQMPPIKEAGPGELCNSGQVCVKGSVCNQQIPLCVCPKGTELVKGRCVERNIEKASKEEKIKDKLSLSSTESTYSTQNKMRPSKIEAKVGEKCSLNADCASGAYCNGNTQPPTCQCLSTHISVHDHCEKVIYPGQKGCETDLQCSAGYAGARCLNGHCICPPGSSALEQTCIPAIAWPGEACNISHLMPVCSADSYCFDGLCVCNPPLTLFQKQCIHLKKNFEENKNQNKKEDKRRSHQRRLHLEEFGGNFDKKLMLSDVLLNNFTRKNVLKNSINKKFNKSSKQELSKRRLKKSKRRKRKLKEEKEEQKENGKERKPTPKISPTFRLIGSKCREGIDHCSVGANCLNSKCVCVEGSVPDAQKRYCRQYPGKNCAKGQLCIGRSECVFGKCKYRRGLELQSFGNISKCGEPKKKTGKMPLAGQLCINNECVTGARCQNGICTCLEGYNLFHGECLPPRASISGTNTFHEHSLLFSPNFPLMDSSTFEMKYKERKDDISEEDPLPSKTVVAGAPCQLSLECPYRTECLRGVCRCKQGETIINGLCRKAIHEVLPGGRCDTQNGVDCIGESHCFYGICVCLYGLVIAGQECANSALMKAVRPGGRCLLGQRCTGRSRCVRSICQCPQGQKADISGGKGCINPTLSTEALKLKKYKTKMDDENQEVEEDDNQKLPKFVYTIPAAVAAAGERGKYNQILTANQMSINLMDSKTLRSLFGPLLKHYSSKKESDEEETRSFGGCKGPNCHVFSSPKFVSPPKSSPTLAVGPPPFDSFNSKKLPESSSSSSLVGIPGTRCGVSSNGQSTSCSGGAICLGGICVCRPGFRPLNGLCQISKVELGERCFINEQCKNNGICINGICHCGTQNKINDNNQISTFHRHKCANRPLASVGDDCTNGQNCGFNSICGIFSGVCECPVGMERNKGICVAAQRPRGTECISSSDCDFHAFCDNGFCICLATYYPIGGHCLPPALAVGEDPKSFINPDLLALILKQNGNRINDEQVEGQNIGRKKKRNADLSEKWKREVLFVMSSKSENLGSSLSTRADRNYLLQTLYGSEGEDQSGREASHKNKTLTSSKLPQLSTSLTKGDGETFASETISSASNYASEMQKEENEKQQITVAPGAQCGPLDVCTGGSTCVEGLCLCPAGTRPSVKSDNCETFEQRKSSIQREQNKKEYSKYTNKVPRMQPGPIDRPYARPSESCANGEICTGGSICQNSNKICECPPNKSILRNHICIQSDEPPMLRVVHAMPGERCNSETNCEGESVCVEGTCRCQSNEFTPKSGNCTRRSVDESSASYQTSITSEAVNSDYDNILPPVQLPEESSELIEVQRPHPKISGPPLRKHSSSIISNILPQLAKSEPTTKGVCPPGNSPTIHRSTGQIINCNGMRPNCPPKSYCFVTGDASETYNCCKSY